jgi:hypothetical protein
MRAMADKPDGFIQDMCASCLIVDRHVSRQNMLVLRCSRKEVSETFNEVWEANGSVLSWMLYSSLVVSTFIRVVNHQMNRYVECK